MQYTGSVAVLLLCLWSLTAAAVETGTDTSGQSLGNVNLNIYNVVTGEFLADVSVQEQEESDGGSIVSVFSTVIKLEPEAARRVKNWKANGLAQAVTNGETESSNSAQADSGGSGAIRSYAGVLRYDSPSIAGFRLDAAWGENDFWDVVARHSGGFGEEWFGKEYSHLDTNSRVIVGPGQPGADLSALTGTGGHVGGPWNPLDIGRTLELWQNRVEQHGQAGVDNSSFQVRGTRITILRPDDLSADLRPYHMDRVTDFDSSGRFEERLYVGRGQTFSASVHSNQNLSGVRYAFRNRWDLECNDLTPEGFAMLNNAFAAAAQGGPQGVNSVGINYKLNHDTSALTIGSNLFHEYQGVEEFQSESIWVYEDVIKAQDRAIKSTSADCSPAVDRQTAAAAGKAHETAPDPKAQPERFPNDGFFHAQRSWGQEFDDQWGLKRIGFAASGRDAQGSLWSGAGHLVTVAVVDTGMDFGHPELAGALWVNFKDNPNNDKDDDDNHHRNDFLGWNFVDDNPLTFDDNGHGTFVAGIIAARTDNGIGIAGINPWAQIMPVKVADALGHSNSVDVAQGIAYAAHMGARVINVSIAGETLTQIEQVAIDEAAKAGALVVVAAGNDGADVRNISPAGLKGVITVAATDHEDQRAGYSNWGGSVDIAAPGSDILSLRAIQTDLLQFIDEEYEPGANILGTDRHYYRLSGTSFAAPYVAGVASLLFSLRPELTAAQVKRMILNSARDIDVPGLDQNTGWGLLNAAAALQADPEFFVEARIENVAVASVDGKTVVRVTGTTDADRFRRSWMEIGAGEDPDKWKKAARTNKKAIRSGILGDIPAAEFQGVSQWTLRVVTEHKNGEKRENRFVLNLQ